MRIRKLADCTEIVAGDSTRLREILHPGREYPFQGRYSLAQAILAPGGESARHRLTTDEVYYIVEGEGEMHIDDESAAVGRGDAIEIPPESVQWIRNTGSGNLVILCIVDPAWRATDERILD